MRSKDILRIGALMLATFFQNAVVHVASADDMGVDGSDGAPPEEVGWFWQRDIWVEIRKLEDRLSSERTLVRQLKKEFRVSKTNVRRLEESHLEQAEKLRKTQTELLAERARRVELENELRSETENQRAKLLSESIARNEIATAVEQIIERNSESTIETGHKMDALRSRVERSEQEVSQENQWIAAKHSRLKRDMFYQALAVAGVLVIAVPILIRVRRRMDARHAALAAQVLDLTEQIRQEQLGSDQRISDLLNQQLATTPSTVSDDSTGTRRDHAFSLQVLDEIHRMRKRLRAMPEATKGVRQLTKALERLEESLEARGYKIVELVGAEYDEGMRVKARFSSDGGLREGAQVITKVIKPQVNFEDVVIQVADVEVSVGG